MNRNHDRRGLPDFVVLAAAADAISGTVAGERLEAGEALSGAVHRLDAMGLRISHDQAKGKLSGDGGGLSHQLSLPASSVASSASRRNTYIPVSSSTMNSASAVILAAKSMRLAGRSCTNSSRAG